MPGDITEAGHLLILTRQVHDRVEHQVGKGKNTWHSLVGEVAERHANPVRSGFRS
jgi:hypothetical protein